MSRRTIGLSLIMTRALFAGALLGTLLCAGSAQQAAAQDSFLLTIQPRAVELATDEVFQLSAELTLSDGTVLDVTEDVEWWTSEPRIARVDNSSGRRGRVTARNVGQATISVRDDITGVTSDESGGNAIVDVLGRLVSLEVRPRDRRVEVGETKSMTALGTFSGGETRDLTDEVMWASSSRRVVRVSNESGRRGRVTALQPGEAFISAESDGGISSSDSDGDARIRVPADLESIRIVPREVQLAVGFTRRLDAEGTFEDGSVDDISNRVTWSTSNSSAVVVSNESGSQGEVIALERGNAVISVVDPETDISSADSDGDALVTVAGSLVALSISPSESQLPAGLSRTFSVIATLDDGSPFSVSRRSVDWASSNPAVATVSNDPSSAGLVTALAEGETTLSVTHPRTGLRSTDSDADAQMTVGPSLTEVVSLEVTPKDRRIDLGETKSMTAKGLFAGGMTVDLTDHVAWTSSDPSVVSVSSRGHVTGQAPGVVFISATIPGVISSSDSDMDGRVRVLADLVSIRIVPGGVTLPVDFSRSLDAEGTFSNGSVADISNKVTWSSSDPSVIAVSDEPDSKGHLMALQSGVAWIRAVEPETGISSSGSDGDAMVTVAGRAVALAVRPSEGQLPVGLSRFFSVEFLLNDESAFPFPRRSVEWTSSNPAVAVVSNDPGTEGLVTAIAQGETVLSAVHLPTGLRSSDSDDSARLTVVPPLEEIVSLEVTPKDRRIDLGESKSMTAIGTFAGEVTADLSDHVVWASSNPRVVSVSNEVGSRGRATALSPGVVHISATVPGIRSSSDSDMDGRVRVLAHLVSIRITPPNVQLPVGSVRSLDAKGTFHNGSEADISNKVDWFTSDPSVVTVSNELESQGELTALRNGTATIGARDPETGISSTASEGDAVVHVRGRIVAVSVRPSNDRLPVGASEKFSVRATLEDGSFLGLSRQSVEWTSSNPTVATVSNEPNTAGLVTALATGEAILSTRHKDTGISSTDSGGDSRLSVAGTIVAIEVRPARRELFIGQTKRFSVFALLDSGGELKLSRDVQFTTSDASVATVTNAHGKRGDATGLAEGTASIAATHLPTGISSSTTNGNAKAVVSGLVKVLRVEPSRAFYLRGTEQEMNLRAVFDDGRTSNIASDVIWTSSDPSVAEVRNEAPKKGVLIAKAFGTVTISALEPFSGVSTTTSDGDGIVTVVDGIEGLAVRGGDLELRTGNRPRLRAFGKFTNPNPLPGEEAHVNIELTDRVEWTSSNPFVIRIQDGRALAVGLGKASVSAYDPDLGLTSTASGGDALFRVVGALKKLVIKPKRIRIRLGSKRRKAFRAIGHFTNGDRVVMTDEVDFFMTDPTIAAVSNERDESGMVAPFTRGKTRVTAIDPVTGVRARRARRLIVRKAK